jgi:RNase adaptor protein for sRNA GlmZ degradation
MAKKIIQQAEENRPDETHVDAQMKVSVVSFSYPRGVPDDPDDDYWGGFVFDCRSLPDPHGIAALKGYSGLDNPVIEFFERHKSQVDRFLNAAESLVRQTIETAPETGRDCLQVAFGCYGGRHRSVYMAERFAERLVGTPGIEIEVKHAAKEFWND